MFMQKLELLAPVGSKEALIAAVENGADAVYLGGTAFSARQQAANFSEEEMLEAIHFAHLRGVKVHVAVNTLVDNSELKELIDYLCFLTGAGADAIIVQDLGVAKIAREMLPSLEVHASTQMTVHNLEGVKMLEELGIARVVLAREMSLDEIRHIAAGTNMEIEVFIHGALCISYSGQCLMSSMIGGRSGNRGRCAQPCRLPYTLVDMQGHTVGTADGIGEYILSPKDLNTIELLPQLIEAGVTSFKIEGRMKRPEYVATVVRNYREALDRYISDHDNYCVPARQQKELAQIFNRDFTTGYLQGSQGLDMISHRRPNNRGIRLGRVVRYSHETRAAVIKLDEELHIGDGIEVWVSVGGRVGTIVTKMENAQGKQLMEAQQGMEVSVPVPEAVRVGDRVFKTNDARLSEAARVTIASSPQRRIPLKVDVTARIGQPMTVRMTDDKGNIAEARTEFIGEAAIKRPLTYESVAEQMQRMGNTVFAIRELNVDIEGSVMVPQSEMNAVRRAAVKQLEELRLAPWAENPDKDAARVKGFAIIDRATTAKAGKRQTAVLAVTVDNDAGLAAAVEGGADLVYFGGDVFGGKDLSRQTYMDALDYCRNRHKKIVFMLPRLIKPGHVPQVIESLADFADMQPDGLAVANVGAWELARKNTSLALYGDYPLNVFNAVSLDFCRQLGLQQAVLSPELTLHQVGVLAASAPLPVECLVHGHVELMVSEYCAVGSIAGGMTGQSSCKQVCRRGRFGLKDRMGFIFPVETDQFCRMHLFNAKELVMLSHIPSLLEAGVSAVRIEGKRKSAQELRRITALYRAVMDQGRDHPIFNNMQALAEVEHQNITRGHYFRGVL